MNKNELKKKIAERREVEVDWYINVCRKIIKLISFAMLFMLIFDISYLVASVYYGTDFYGFIGTSVIVVLELLTFLCASIKKFRFAKAGSIILVAIIELLPILSFLYFGIYLGFIYVLILAFLRFLTVALFLMISFYKVNENVPKKSAKKTYKENGKKVTKEYFIAKTPTKKAISLTISCLICAISLFVVGFLNAGTGVMKDFTRRIAYSQSEEEGTVNVSKVLDGLALLEIPNEVSILSFSGYKTYSVTGIKEGAFSGVNYLETVKITEGIKNIENGAFVNSSVKRLEIDSEAVNFNNSLENTSICEIQFNKAKCESDLSSENLFNVNQVIVNRDVINDYRKKYVNIECLFVPNIAENEIFINFNNTEIDTLIVTKGEDGSVTVNDPFSDQQQSDEKVEDGRKYKFIWWNKTNNDSLTKVKFPFTVNESVNLFAEWVPIYNIDYVMNEGVSNETLLDRFYFTGENISIPSASKEGYTFMGWYDNEKFDGASITTIAHDTPNDVTLYAKFLKNYHISYDLGYDGAEVPSEYEVLYHQETPNITLQTPTRRGYNFGGWYLGDTKVETLECANGGDVKFTAKWDIITYKIEYVYADLIQGLNTNVIEYTVETEDIILSDLALSGYDFLGWYSDKSMDESSKIDSVAIPTNSIEDKVFYAKWELNKSIVSNEAGYTGIYDGNQHEIKVEASHNAPEERNVVYSYIWYKDGEKLDFESEDGSYFVKNVLESGVYYCEVIASDGEYTSQALASQEINVEISKADYDMSGVIYVDLTKVYDGNTYYPTIENELPIGFDGVQLTVTYSEGAKVVSESGKVVTATFATESTNYNTPSPMEARIIINPAKITNIQTNAYEGTYDGKSHASVYSSAESVNSEPITFTYSFDVDGEYQTEIPQLKDNGIYTIYYKVSAPNHIQESGNFFTVKIHKNEVTIKIDSVSSVYGETTKPLTAQVMLGKLYDDNAYELNTDVISTTSVGKYNINFTQLNDNYDFKVLNTNESYTVLPATITGIETNAYNGIYDGASHISVSASAIAVNSQAVVFTYSTEENGEYSENIPMFENAGSYKVYYKVNAANHNEVTGSYIVNIEKYEITVDWTVPSSIIYNGENQAQKIVATYKDVYGQTINLSVSIKDTKSSSTSFVNASDYIATASFANGETNYVLPSDITENCSIQKLAVSVIANDKTMTYGDSVPTLDWSYNLGSNQFVSNDNITLQLTTEATSKSNVSNYDITFATLNNSNYQVSYTKGTLTVEKRGITVSVVGQSSIYGASIKPITGNVTVSSMVNNDTNVYTLTTNATSTSNVGKYDVSVTVNNSNYTVSLVDNVDAYEILKANLTLVKENGYTGIYDGKIHNGSLEFTSVNGQAITYKYTVNGETYNTMPTFENVGTYTVNYVVSANNHNDYQGSFTVKITPKEVVINWTENNFTYTGSEQTVEAYYNDVNGNKVYLTVSMNNEFKNAGNSYVATASFKNGETNYGLPTTVTKSYEIKKLSVSVVANNKTMTYGDTVPALDWSYKSGSNQFVAKDNITLQLNTTATSKSNVSSYDITFATLNNSNYQVSYEKGTLTIEKRAITVTVDGGSSIYGDTISAITGNVTSGSVVNNDTNVYTLTTSATRTSNVGKYDVGVTVNNGNYTVSLVNNENAYEIVNADLMLNSVNGYNGVYDGSKHGGNIVISSVNSQNVTYVYSVNGQTYNTMPTFENVGTYTVNYVASANNHNDYQGNFTVKITPKEVTVNWTENSFVYTGNTQVVEAWYNDVNGNKVNLTVTMNKEFKNAGNSYVATASFKNNETNYVLPTTVTKSYQISKADLTLVKENGYNGVYDGKPHGGSLEFTSVNGQAITYKYTVNGETYNTMPTFENVGTYTVSYVVSANNHNDYQGSFTVKITPKEVVINWTENNFTYTGSEQTVEAWYNDVNGTKVNLTVSMNKEFKNAGNDYLATASFKNNETNYVLPTTVTKSYEIKKLAVSVIANNKTMTYGDIVPTFDWSYKSGSNQFVAKDNITLQLTTEATSKSNVSSYDITFATLNNSNYQVSYEKGTLTIEKRAITVTVDGGSSIYGDTISAITGNVTSGLVVNNDTNVYTLTTSATRTSNVGKYDVGVTVNNGNYTVSLVNNENAYEIVNADLMLNSANGYNGVYDGSKHGGNVVISSVNGQNVTYIYSVNGQTYNTMPTFENVGTYTVNYVASALNHNDYEGSFTVKITPKEVTVNWTENSFVYNGNTQVIEAWYNDVNGNKVNLTVTMNKEFKNAANDYVATVSFENNETNYVLQNETTKTYEIKKLSVSIVATSFEIVKGEEIPELTWEYEQDSNEFIGADNVEVILNTEASETSEADSYSITFEEITNENYEVTYVNGVLTITVENEEI